MLNFWKLHKIVHLKLLGTFLAAVGLVLGGMAVLVPGKLRQMSDEEVGRRAFAAAVGLSASVATPILSGLQEAVPALIENIAQTPGIDYLVVVDAGGAVVASTFRGVSPEPIRAAVEQGRKTKTAGLQDGIRVNESEYIQARSPIAESRGGMAFAGGSRDVARSAALRGFWSSFAVLAVGGFFLAVVGAVVGGYVVAAAPTADNGGETEDGAESAVLSPGVSETAGIVSNNPETVSETPEKPEKKDEQRELVYDPKLQDIERQVSGLLAEVSANAEREAAERDRLRADLKGEVETLVSSVNAMFGSVSAEVEGIAGSLNAVRNDVKSDASGSAQVMADTLAKIKDEIKSEMQTGIEMIKIERGRAPEAPEISVPVIGGLPGQLDPLSAGSRMAVSEVMARMERIRDAVRLVREKVGVLNDRTGEVASVVEIMNEVVTRTIMWGMNVAIEASKTGGQGGRFYALADEVQHISDSGTMAVRRVSEIARSIQSEMTAALIAVERGNMEADEGVRLGERAGEALRNPQVVNFMFFPETGAEAFLRTPGRVPGNVIDVSASAGSGRSAGHAAMPADLPEGDRKTALVVSDSASIRKYASIVLERRGLVVKAVPCEAAAWPGGSGEHMVIVLDTDEDSKWVEFLATARMSAGGAGEPAPKVVALVPRNANGLIEDLAALGVGHRIEKPFDEDVLAKEVGDLLDAGESRRERA